MRLVTHQNNWHPEETQVGYWSKDHAKTWYWFIYIYISDQKTMVAKRPLETEADTEAHATGVLGASEVPQEVRILVSISELRFICSL